MNHEFVASNTRLSYHIRGAGETVVFLHPTPLDHDYWVPLVERLPGLYAVAPDLRGHGISELGDGLPAGGFALAPDAPVLSMEQYASDVISLLDHLNLPHAIFAGCSIGGYILLELWRRIPHRIKGLAFVCSKPQPDAEQGRQKRAENIAKARAGELSGIYDGMSVSLTGESARKRQPDLAASVRGYMTPGVEAFTAIQAGLATRPDSVATVSTITVPVLAIAGGEDSAVTPAEMEAFKTAPGECDFRLLEHAGHFAALEQPGQVAEIFSEWLHSDRLE
jgi:pimeloyl-ACP methyl ester carboxylesterase